MEMQVAAGWNGSIEFYNDCDVTSDVISTKTISNAAVTYYENIERNYIENNNLYINIKVSDVASINGGVTLNLREPNEGEACSTAIPAASL